MDCSTLSELYTERVRAIDDSNPQVHFTVSQWGTTAPACPPESPCSLPTTVFLQAGSMVKSYQTYNRQTITDIVLSQAAMLALRSSGAKYPKRCFKPVNHVVDKIEVFNTPGSRKGESFACYEESLMFGVCPGGKYGFEGRTFRNDLTSFPHGSFAGISLNDFIISRNPNLGIKLQPNGAELQKAFSRIRPSLSSYLERLSVGNFLIELRELGRLSDIFVRKYKSIAAALGSTHLGVAFGVAPLIRDIQSMQQIARNLDKFLIAWHEMAKKNTIMSFHETIYKYESEDTDEFVNTYLPSPWSIDTTIKSNHTSTAKLHLYVRPRPIENLPRARRRARRYLFRENDWAAIAWEAMPFSFVIDWFTGFGANFNAQVDDVLKFDVVDCGYSVLNKLVSEATGISTFTESHVAVCHDEQVDPIVHTTSEYTRVALDPSVFYAITLYDREVEWSWRALTPGQQLLGASLIGTVFGR